MHLSYQGGVRGPCSLVTDGVACWRRFAENGGLPRAVASRQPPLASCEASYATMPRRPGYQRDDPSVVYYEVSLNP